MIEKHLIVFEPYQQEKNPGYRQMRKGETYIWLMERQNKIDT